MGGNEQAAGRTATVGPSGHRLVNHAGDCVIEAWGPTAASCASEALGALVESFAIPREAPATSMRLVSTGPGGPEAALVALLEEVIYDLEVHGEVPVRVALAEDRDGGMSGEMDLVPATAMRLVGPVPKAITYHGLEMSEADGAWRCHVLVDL